VGVTPKVVEAMATITTKVDMEGMEGKEGPHVFLEL